MVLFGPPDLDKLKAKGNIKGLIKALHYGTNEKHQYIAELSKKYLGDIGEPAVEPLIEALNDKGWFTNKAAAEILGIIGDKRAIVPLSNTLNHKNQVVSTAALGALANFGTNAFIPLIEVLISDGAEDLKVEASEALMWIFPQHSYLFKDLERRKNKSLKYKIAYIDLVGETKDPRAIKPLSSLMSDRSSGVRHAAVVALGKIGGPFAVEAILPAIDDKDFDVRRDAIRTLGKIGNSQAVEALLPALNSNSRDTRCESAEALGKIGDPSTIKALQGVLNVF